MAQYKVLQDIEAEDKLLGPLSLRQFIYAVIVVVLGFVAFKLLTFRWYLAIPFLPPMMFFGLLAAPFGRDQPSEVWLLAKIRFFFKPRKRIWDQTGIKELVTITVPKKIERIVSKGFSEQEKRSRLKALAATLDTRGWAVKNIDASTFQPRVLASGTVSDRLVDIESIPNDVINVDVDPVNDILDENSPLAQHVGEELQESRDTQRQQLLDRVHALASSQSLANNTASVSISPAMQTLMEEIEKNQANEVSQEVSPKPSVQGSQPPTPPQSTAPTRPQQLPPSQPSSTITIAHEQTSVTPKADPGILKLVQNNDRNVASLGRERRKEQEPPEDEVVISLR